MIRVFGIPNCDKIRSTRKWLRENNIDHEFVDLKKEPFSEQDLIDLANKLGLDVLVNRRGMTWRNLGLSGKELSDDDLLEILLENQTMIKRPLIQNGEAVIIGYDEDSLADFTA